jgi:lipoate-protein ligase B
MDYQECLSLQQNLHQKVVEESLPGYFLSVEHPPVITLGNQGDSNSVLASHDYLSKQGIQVVPTDRGGDVTAHEPGQLILYPILNLAHHPVGPRQFVEIIQKAVIDWLAAQEIQACTDSKNPGVWIGSQKVCALGIRFKKRATYHGLAINLNNTLETFKWIIPCGLQGKGVVSVKQLKGGQTLDLTQAATEITQSIRSLLRGYPT